MADTLSFVRNSSIGVGHYFKFCLTAVCRHIVTNSDLHLSEHFYLRHQTTKKNMTLGTVRSCLRTRYNVHQRRPITVDDVSSSDQVWSSHLLAGSISDSFASHVRSQTLDHLALG